MRIDATLAWAIATIALVGAGCASASTSPAGTPPAGASAIAGVSDGAPDSSAHESSVIVLGDGVEGGIGLWRFQAPGKWTAVGAIQGATAVGRTADGVVVVTGQRAELRSSADLGRGAATITLKWPATAPDWWTVQQFLDHLTPRNIGQAVFPLMGFDARMTGAASLADLDTVAADQRQTTRLREVRTRTPPLTVAPDALLSQLIMPLHLHGGVAIVIEDGHPVGVVTEADLTRAEMLADLGWDGPRPTNLSVS